MVMLVEPQRGLHASWVASMREFEGAVLHGYATFRFEVDELASARGFERWLALERALRDRAPEGLVPATAWWIVDEAAPGTVLGAIHLRHALNDALLADGGHIGYGIRPSARGRGVASAALRLVLERARAMGIERALLCCDDDNPASRRTILGAGGELEDVRAGTERYWIDLG